MPAAAATRVATGKAIAVKRLSFISVQNLDFGSVLAGTTAGTVVLAPTGVRTKTGGVTLVNTGASSQAARFAGAGTSGQSVVISMAATPITITRVGGTQTMQVNTFVIGSTPTVVLTTAPLGFVIGSTTGAFNFPLGATLNVGANQTPGDYQGTFSLILNYL